MNCSDVVVIDSITAHKNYASFPVYGSIVTRCCGVRIEEKRNEPSELVFLYKGEEKER